MAHALLSPSSAPRWLVCPGSVAMEQKCAASTSEYADQGTVAHHIAALCLTNNFSDAAAYKGRVFKVTNGTVEDDKAPKLRGQTRDFVSTHEVDDDMVDAVNTYVEHMKNYAFASEAFMVEQALDIGHITGEEGAKGTADAIVFKGNSLQVHDYKHGKGKRVSASSAQLAIYGLAALKLADFLGFAPTTVHCFIHQPRLRRDPDHYEYSVEKLLKYKEAVGEGAAVAMKLLQNGKGEVALNPGEEQCHFCAAKATCPAVRKVAWKTCFADFDAAMKEPEKAVPALPTPETEEEWLTASLQLVPLIEGWCKAVEAEAFRRASNGIAVPGFKLVLGKEGNRAWADEEKTAKALKAAGFDEDDIYAKKLITPPAAEKMLKKSLPSLWEALKDHISRPPAKPSLVPASDERPAITVGSPADDFQSTVTVKDLI